MQIVLILIGVFLFINGSFMAVVSNFNIGVIITILSGMFFIAWGIFYKKINSAAKSGVLRWLKYIVYAGIILECLLLLFIAVYGQADNAAYDEDAVIVLGAGIRGDRVSVPLAYRLNKAVSYYEKNPDAVIVVTGGKGFQESVTEAYAMKKYLVGRGVDPEKIIMEDRATSTNENMRFSKEILDKHFNGKYKSVVITNNFHVYRSVMIAKIEGLDNVTHIHAGLRWYNLAPCYLRESLAVLKMYFFDM